MRKPKFRSILPRLRSWQTALGPLRSQGAAPTLRTPHLNASEQTLKGDSQPPSPGAAASASRAPPPSRDPRGLAPAAEHAGKRCPLPGPRASARGRWAGCAGGVHAGGPGARGRGPGAGTGEKPRGGKAPSRSRLLSTFLPLPRRCPRLGPPASGGANRAELRAEGPLLCWLIVNNSSEKRSRARSPGCPVQAAASDFQGRLSPSHPGVLALGFSHA